MGNGNLFHHTGHHITDEVVNEILIRLPIKDAVRTSVLSRNWRLQWQKMSRLVFDVASIIAPLGNQQQQTQLARQQQTQLAHHKLARIVNRVLSVHVGSVESFILSASVPRFLDLDEWITVLCRKQVKEITLRFSSTLPYYSVPSCLFNCHRLTHLELCGCQLWPPLSVARLPNLKSLHLRSMYDNGGKAEDIISKSPSLEVLSLEFVRGPKCLKLFAPRLQILIIKSIWFDVTIYDAPGVKYLTFHLYRPCNGIYEGGIQVANILNRVVEVKELQLTCASIPWLYRGGDIPDSLQKTYECLERLMVSMNFNAAEVIIAFFCLCRSFPNIKSLDIQAQSYGKASSVSCLSGLKETSVTFHQLRTVRVENIIGAQHELLLIKYILANAPALRAIEFSINNARRLVDDDSHICTEIMRFPRASPAAEVIPKEKMAPLYHNYELLWPT